MSGKRVRVGLENAGKRAETLQQAARQRLHVAAGNGLHQQEFDHFVIRQRFIPAVDEPLAQAPPMPGGIIGRRFPFAGHAFIEEWGLIWHILYKQLPFPRVQRK